MSRIAWYSNACHVPSGYGMQTAQVVHQMVKDGHEVAITANHGAQVMMNCTHGHPILPEGLIRYSLDAAPENIKTWIGDQPGFGVVLFDLWPLIGVEGFNDLNLACWTPIDHDPVPPPVARFAFEGRHHIIAMSRFGEDRLLKAGIPREELTYIPHAIDTALFSDKGKSARSSMGIPEEAFLVITNAANRGRIPVRKAFGEMADAMATFMRDRPDVYWMMHTEPNGHSEGVNIPRLLAAVGIDPKRVRYPHPVHFRNGIPQEAIASIYSAADVQLLTSMGEGFGIPAIESQACGTPVIVSNFTAQPELVGPHGKIVPVQRVWDEFQQSFFAIPNVLAIVSALQEVYEETKAGKVDRAAVSAAMGQYEQTKVYSESWKPLIELMTARKRVPAQPVPLNREQRRGAKKGK
jgi:glycosyltransferase involved in cell wall biosynthesis